MTTCSFKFQTAFVSSPLSSLVPQRPSLLRSNYLSGQSLIRYRTTRLSRSFHPQTKPTTITMAAAAAAAEDRKMLHVVYRIGDITNTRKFLEALGMHVLRERDIPSEKYTNVFYGYGPEQKGEYFSLELTYNYGVDSYEVGTGFGHITIAVKDQDEIISKLTSQGFEMSTKDDDGAVYYKDPTGYTFQIVQRNQRDPVCQLMYYVKNIDSAITFYKAMGMNVIRQVNDEKVFMGFGPEDDSTILQLVVTDQPITNGDGYGQIAVSCPDVFKAAKSFEDQGIPIARPPGEVPGIGTKITAVKDSDGWKTVMVDAADFEKEFE